MMHVKEFNDTYGEYRRNKCPSEQAARLAEYLQRKSPHAIELVRTDQENYPVFLFRKRDWQGGLIYAFVSEEELAVYWSTSHTHILVGGGGLYLLTTDERLRLTELESNHASESDLERVRWRITVRILLEVVAGLTKSPD